MAYRIAERSAGNSRLSMYPPELPQTHDPKEIQKHHAPELERQLLRSGVRKMATHRWQCSQCGRSPLVGERLQVFGGEASERVVCELCLSRSGSAHGEPLRTERVRAGERRLNVRRAA
jgi:hypothetical protein